MSATVESAALIKLAQADYPIHELLQKRWSPRAFAPRLVEPNKLLSLLEAARWAASGGNQQPWSFLIATQDQPEIFARMVSCLAETNALWASQAPVLGIAVTRLTRLSGQPNRTALYDLGLAVQNLVIQATALDLYVHQMGGFSQEKARAEFAIPEAYEPVVILAIGYLGDPETLTEKQRELELNPRIRHPLSKFVFSNRWGEVSPVVQP